MDALPPDLEQAWRRAHPDEADRVDDLEWVVVVRLHDEPRWVVWPQAFARVHVALIAECRGMAYPGTLRALEALETLRAAGRHEFRFWGWVQWCPEDQGLHALGVAVIESFAEPDVPGDDGLVGPFSDEGNALIAAQALTEGNECMSHYAPPAWL